MYLNLELKDKDNLTDYLISNYNNLINMSVNQIK